MLEGGSEQEDQVATPAGDVPLGFDGFRVHPPGRQVRGEEEKGVREQQVEVACSGVGCDACRRIGPAARRLEPRAQGVDRRGVVVGGAKALAIGGSQRGQQDVDLRRESSCVAPGGTLTAVDVEATQSLPAEQVLARGGARYQSRLEIGRRRAGRRMLIRAPRSRCDGKAGRESNEG